MNDFDISSQEILAARVAELELENAALRERLRWAPVAENPPPVRTPVLIAWDRPSYMRRFYYVAEVWPVAGGISWRSYPGGHVLKPPTHWALPALPETDTARAERGEG